MRKVFRFLENKSPAGKVKDLFLKINSWPVPDHVSADTMLELKKCEKEILEALETHKM